MGTTLTAMTTTAGLKLQFVVAIEGFESLLTDGPTAAAVTAWAAHADYAAAIGGLMLVGQVEQKLEPWNSTLDVSRLSFAVLPSADTAAGDTFGRLVFGTGNGNSTFLNAALDADDTTATVLSTSTFASSGTIHVGTEAIAYSGKTATTFTGLTRGKFSAARRESSGRIGHEHRLPVIGEGISIAPLVTSLQRVWKGRWVTVWAHRDVGGTLDVLAQAQMIWAGRIAGVRDEVNGMTYVDCEDVRSALRDCVLMRDQFTARVAEGIYLKAGWAIGASDIKAGALLTANALKIVSSGAVAPNEVLAGTYTLSEVTDQINTWLAAEKAAVRLGFQWKLDTTTGGPHSKFEWSVGGVGTNGAAFTAPSALRSFLGWPGTGSDDNIGSIESGIWATATSKTLTSPSEPYRIYMAGGASGNTVVINGARGTWWDNKTYLPTVLGNVSFASDVGVMQLNNGPMALFKYTSATSVICLGGAPVLDSISGVPWDDAIEFRRVLASGEGDFSLRQVAVIQYRFKWLMTMTACSTGTTNHNYNAAAGDRFPSQLGAAIPWELLGTNWVSSLSAVDEAMSTTLLVIEKPTKWTEVFGADLVARVLNLVWKNQGLVVRAWGTPTAAHSLHALAEASKAAPANAKDVHRTVANDTDEFLVNSIKIEYNRVLSGGYGSTITLSAPASQDAYGAHPVTISLRNTSGGVFQTQTVVEELADDLAMSAAMFMHPLRILRRTVAMPYYENMAPGDFCTLTDAYVRAPATGARGITSLPGLIVRHRVDWGGYEIDSGGTRSPSAEVDILILALANISNYSPAAEVDSTTANGGYVVATKVLTCRANVHSESSEAVDASHFDVGDKIYVVETDPDDPASFLSWSDTVAARSGNTITVTVGLAGWDAAKFYRVISDVYGTAVTAQKADVYQADDADGMVADTVGAYAYGNDPGQATTWTDDAGAGGVADLPMLYANTGYGDGRPLDTGAEMDLARLCNAMVNYRTAPYFSTVNNSTLTYTGTGTKILEIVPVHLGPGDLIAGTRSVRIGSWCRSADGTSATVTISLCRHPPIGTSLTSADTTSPNYLLVGPYESWTSGAITSRTYALKVNDFSFASVDPFTGLAYIVVEGTSKMETKGICQGQALRYTEA